jgi:hypothetical protein
MNHCSANLLGYLPLMNSQIRNAMAVWKTAELDARDAEALLDLEATKYLEGISGPPSLRLLQLTEELRRTSNRALAATIGLLMSFEPG